MAPRGSASGPSFYFLAKLGSEVRRRRKDAGLTVQQLADAAGLSRRGLTEIELGRANPNLATVDRLARALHTDFAALVQGRTPLPIAVQPVGAGTGIWTTATGSSAVFVAATDLRPAAELWDWTIQPGDHYEGHPDPPGSQELFIVISGALTIAAEGQPTVTVAAGESARLATDRVYRYTNAGAEPVRFIRVAQIVT